MSSADNMNIDVNYVANLARLSLSPEEKTLFQRQLNDIVGYMREIERVNLEGVEPTSHAVPIRNVFRADEPRKGLEREEALANAPLGDGRQFMVPRIVL
jgi:aspartyl-tRNA(Asn)/glutamyl-tRNA(Gln) amidotransferase subunit C